MLPSSLLAVLAALAQLQLGQASLFPQDQHVFDSSKHTLSNSGKHGTLRRFHPESEHDFAKLLHTAQKLDWDIWHTSRNSHQSKQPVVDIYFPPHDTLPLPSFLTHIAANFSQIPIGIPPQSTYRASSVEALPNSSFHSSYHPLHEVDSFLRQLAEAYPETAKLTPVGRSWEGREVWGLTLSNSSSNPPPERASQGKKPIPVNEKLGFVIVGAQHAREWIATASALHLAHALLTPRTPETPNGLSYLLDEFDFHVVPTPNPDGYTYTWEGDRFWYKNRQELGPNVNCLGIDMNRNWGYKWKPRSEDGGPTFQFGSREDEEWVIVDHEDTFPPNNDSLSGPSKKCKTRNGEVFSLDEWREQKGEKAKKMKKPKQPVDPCSHWYPGSRRWQAPEVNNLANYISVLPNVVAFVDFRSYGQMLSTPYSYSCNRYPKDAEDQAEAAQGAVAALRSVHGVAFQTGTLCEQLYRAPGNMLDWTYQRGGVKYAYAAHLRDTGTYGFSLPPEFIRPTGEETGEMVKYIATFVAQQLGRTL